MFVMKLKPIFSATVTLFMFSNSLAADSIRVGISLGSASHETRLKMDDTGIESKFKKQSPSVGAFIGYDHLVSETPLFIGLEAGINNQNSEKTQYAYASPSAYNSSGSLKLKTNNSAIGALRIGVVAKDVLIYAKTGLSSTNWQVSIKGPSGDRQTNYQKLGHVFGFGLECNMNPNFSFGLEYQYTRHNVLRNTYPELSTKISPVTQTTALRLIYSL